MCTLVTRSRALSFWLGAAAVALVALAASPVLAQVTAGYSEYYVPGGEDEMHLAFRTMGGGTISASTHATITITAWADNTTVYYDHWENGLNFDPVTLSGVDATFNLGPTGSVLTLDNTPAGGIPIPRNLANTYYDGGDRIYVAGGAVTVTRASYPQARAGVDPGLTVQAVAWEVYPVKPQLTTYILPFGENLSGSFPDFLRTYVLVQATANGTTFTVDLNGDETADRLDQNFDGDTDDAGDTTTVTLQAGQTFFLGNVAVNPNPMPRGARATINSGAIIQGNSTLQVKFVIGDPGATYETRGISAFPRGYWTRDYYAPVNEPAAAPVTDIFLYNPNASSITVDWQTLAGSGSFTIGADTTVSYRAVVGALPTGGGVYLRGSDVFWGVSTIDSTGPTNEWAYSLLPSTLLYSEHFLGWAPGGADGNDSGVFLTVVQDNTRVFVDTNSDGAADQTYTLNRLQTQYIVDADGDLSGTHFWATGPFTMSFGQNPDTAPAQALSGDLGYVAIPGTDFISLVLAVDKTASPQVVPTASGAQASFTLTVSSQKYTVDGVTISDTLPPSWQYVPGSTTITRPDLTTLSGAGANPTIAGQVLSWSAAQTGGNMAANQRIVITFTAQTTADLATGTLSENRVKAVGTRTVGSVTQTFTTTDFAYVVSQGTAGTTVQITKASSVPAATPLYPGDPLTYTTTVTNPAGAGSTLTGVSLYDPMPSGLSYAGGASLTCDRGTTANLRDQFASQAYNLTNGSVNWSASPWVETDNYAGGGSGPTGGFVWITPGQLQFRYLQANVADTFQSVSYARQNGNINWTSNWIETGDDGNPAAGIITANGTRLNFGPGTVGACPGPTCRAITRTAPVPAGADTATISFTLSDNGIEAGEGLIAEYSFDGTTWTEIQRLNNATLTPANPLPAVPIPTGATSISLRFRSFDTGNGAFDFGDSAGVDNVNIAFIGAQIRRTANLSGAGNPSLTFTVASAGLDAGQDTVVLEASAFTNGPWTTLATFNAGAPDNAQPYDLTNLVSGTTTIRFRVTGGFETAGETFSVDNVDITYYVADAVAVSGPPEFLSAAGGCVIRPGGIPVTLTFNATVNDPLPTGLTSITNTASTTSVELPFAVNASVTNIVTNPSVQSASVAGRVWLDSDGDAIPDFGEPGIANVEVTLKDQWGTPIATLYTDVGGRYLFPGVEPGDDYYVEVERGAAGRRRAVVPGRGDLRQPPLDPVRRSTAGENETGVDLGYRPAAGTVIFGDQAWVDANANGLRDAGEVALAGATIDLFLDDGDGFLEPSETTPLATTTSDASGHYVLGVSGLAGGEDYFVGVRAVTGYSLTTAGTYYFQDVIAGSAYLTADFGFVGTTLTTYSISDRVWFDMDASMAQNGTESGIAGVTVDLLDASLNVIATAITAADGTFTFSGVRNGNYTVRISDTGGVLADYTGTTAWAVARQRAETVAGANVSHLAPPSYGFRPTRSIGDTVFFDTSGNGVQDTGEGGIPGIVVELYQAGALRYTTTTDANGHYFFAGLTDGSYVVSVPTLTGYTFTGTDADGGMAGLQLNATIAGGASYWDADFGFLATTPRTLSGVVWNDTDGDGAVDAGETGIAGVTLDILSGTTVVATVSTDAVGAYSVQGLAAGPYTVELTDDNGVLGGLLATYEGVGGVSHTIDLQEPVDLTGGDVSAVNFGYRPPQVTFANVASFRAYLAEGAVVVEWRTSVEVGTAGFHLSRLDPATGGWRQLDDRLLPGLVRHQEGGTYRFVDGGAAGEAGARLTYLLEEVDRRGRRQAHGPYTVALAAEDAASALGARRALRGARFDREPAIDVPCHPGPDPSRSRGTPECTRGESGTARRLDRSDHRRERALLPHSGRDRRSCGRVCGRRAGPDSESSTDAVTSWEPGELPAGPAERGDLLLRRARRQHLHRGERVPDRPRCGEDDERDRGRPAGQPGLAGRAGDVLRRDGARRAGPVHRHGGRPESGGRLLVLGLRLRRLPGARHRDRGGARPRCRRHGSGDIDGAHGRWLRRGRRARPPRDRLLERKSRGRVLVGRSRAPRDRDPAEPRRPAGGRERARPPGRAEPRRLSEHRLPRCRGSALRTPLPRGRRPDRLQRAGRCRRSGRRLLLAGRAPARRDETRGAEAGRAFQRRRAGRWLPDPLRRPRCEACRRALPGARLLARLGPAPGGRLADAGTAQRGQPGGVRADRSRLARGGRAGAGGLSQRPGHDDPGRPARGHLLRVQRRDRGADGHHGSSCATPWRRGRQRRAT